MALDLRWEEIFRTRAWGKYPPEEFIRFMAANFYRHPARQEVKVFEAGFGTGANLWYAAREGFTVAYQTPEEVAAKVVGAVKRNRFFIFSHPEYRPILEARLPRRAGASGVSLKSRAALPGRAVPG